jgi:hypothetical protein
VIEAGYLRDAVAALYSCDPDEFTERRKVLAGHAREAGDKALARTIAGLRKPTRSAWVINQLVRADPDAVPRMTALGDELRAAEQALDGARIRELSRTRRDLVVSLLRQAFATVGQPAPSAALRDEVTATLSAALADPRVASQLQAGTLLRAVHRDGFAQLEAENLDLGPDLPSSSSGTPAPSRSGRRHLRLVRTPPDPGHPGSDEPGPDQPDRDQHDPAQPDRKQPHRKKPAPSQPDTAGRAAAARRHSSQAPDGPPTAAERAERKARAQQEREERGRARQEEADRARAERERRRAAVADAREAAAEADRAARAATREEQDLASSVHQLTEDLAQARQQHAEARVMARHAQAAQRRAHETLDRLRGSPAR